MYSLKTYTCPYVILSSDFSQQEPRLTGFVAQDKNMIQAFQEGKDIYAAIASIAFNTNYEDCLEFNPETGEYQPEGKARRNEAKVIVLGITYGRSVASIGEQLYHSRDDMTDEEKTQGAQRVYDSVMKAFPALERLMVRSQAYARKHGYVETILGRRRHLPDMTLPEFEFKPLPGYVNPDIDPLDVSTLDVESGIPQHKLKELEAEFSKFKYYGQVVKRTKQLYEEENIKVINHRPKINDAKRQCVNCVDAETEILTKSGWKKYNQISEGEEIFSYSLESNEIVRDKINAIHISEAETEVYHLYTSTFDAMCTLNHRWVMRNFDTNNVKFYDTEHILKFHRPRYHILRIAPIRIFENIKMDVPLFCKDVLENKISFSEILTLGCYNANQCCEFFRDNYLKNGCIDFSSEEVADKFQLICFMAGKVGNKRKQFIERKNKEDITKWKVSCSKRNLYQTARIDMMKKEKEVTNLVWCVTTGQGAWIARRNGKYYITGNSIIQGSAADFTKTALINVMTDPRWKNIGGQVLTVVHDEIVAQVPVENWEEGASILREDMESAGSFLPFPIKCDVTASYRWYGLELPCKFTKPENLELDSENDISWVQWHLVEVGFELPIFKDKNGNKPIGDAAHGVSGQISQEMLDSIELYCNRYNINKVDFLDDIEKRVEAGSVTRED